MADRPKLSNTSFVYPVRSLLEGRIQPHSEAATSPGPNASGEPPTGFFNFIQDTRRIDALSPPPLGEIGPSLDTPTASSSRPVDSDKPSPARKRRGTRKRSSSASAILEPDTPRTGNDSEPARTHKSRRRKSARKPSPNFRHFPAGDNPYFPRSFSTTNDQSTPTSLSVGNMETVPTTMSAAHFLGHRNPATSPGPLSPPLFTGDVHDPMPPIPLLSGEPSSSDSSQSLTSEETTPQQDEPIACPSSTRDPTPPTIDIETPEIPNIDDPPPPWFVDHMATPIATRPGGDADPVQDDDDEEPQLPFNPSEYGIVHLPPIPSSVSESGRASSASSMSRSGRSAPTSDRRRIAMAPITSGLVCPEPANSSSAQSMAVSKNDSSQGSSQDQSSSAVSNSGGSLTSDDAYLTFRFQYHQDENGHHVVVGREGKLQSCEDEPIRTPGAVQGYGVLIAVDEMEDTLVVRQVSENATEILGLPPKYLFGLECFTDTLPDAQVGLLWDNIQFLTESDQTDDEESSPHVFLLTGYGAPGTAYANEDESEDGKRLWACWCAVHRAQAYSSEGSVSPGLIVMEFELERDPHNPLYPPVASQQGSGGVSPSTSYGGSSTATGGSSDATLMDGRARYESPSSDLSTLSGSSTASTASLVTPEAVVTTPPEVASTVLVPAEVEVDEPEYVPSAEDIIDSTTSRSRPLPALERLRRMTRTSSVYAGPETPNANPSPSGGPLTAKSRRARRGRGASAVGMMDVFAVMAQINEQLGSAPDLDTFLKIVVGVIKDLTQFHRVLVYQFDEMWNGKVVAELVDWSQSHDLYRGLHFPAGDIPAQARELYTINKVRLLYDRELPTARIVVRNKDDLESPLNMTHCYLRAMSPIHIKYLENMGVRASMSVSIMAFGQLWGLVTCHSYGAHGMRVSFPVRQMLKLLSQSISKNIERLSYAQRLRTRKLINTMTSDHHPTGYIVSNANDLLGLFDADFGILVIGEGAKILGPNQHGQEILIMAEYLRLKQYDTIQASQAVVQDYPDLHLSTGLEVIAGLLYVPLSSGGKDFIAFLRKGQPRRVHWAGKPYKEGEDLSSKLEPRKSFKTWSEIVAGRCRAWTDEELETAGVLALVYGKFIEVWRQKENALQTTKLTNLLLSNASHEVRTPLNHIINYLEMALNGTLDSETRDNLSRSHAASKSLLFTINDLLDLTRLESGNETSFNEPFDLHFAIEEATRLYSKEAERRDLKFILDLMDSPTIVVGDAKKICTVVQNLTANALKYTTSGSITVCCTTFGEPEGLRSTNQTAVEIIVADTGCGIAPEKLESIFREFEQVESSEPKTSSDAGVGLGLAVVARIVEQLGGQLRVDSKVGEGSQFSFLIPLSLSVEVDRSAGSSRSSGSSRPAQPSKPGSRPRSLFTGTSEHEIENLVQALSSNHMTSSRESLRDTTNESKSIELPSQPPATRQPSAGRFDVTDSSIPIRPVKVDEFDRPMVSPPMPSPRSEKLFAGGYFTNIPMSPSSLSAAGSTISTSYSSTTFTSSKSLAEPIESGKLRVLIVEDNDINRTILAKRLTLNGHLVVNTTNGQEGLDKVTVDRSFDLVLMDIQMPILNGFEATRGIRELEKAQPVPNRRLSQNLNGRIPIFAVSASLLEQQRDTLSDCGMDGWILKPIDFKRLNVILKGILDPEQRQKDVYQPGCNWEAGGWLKERQV